MPLLEAPLLETERLRLRGYRATDFSAYAALWSDPVTVRHTTGNPLSPEDAWKKMLRNAGLWPVLGFGYWAIEEKSSGELIGEAGFADFKRGIQPSLDGSLEAGWILDSRAHGKGYATEAVRATIAWGKEHFPQQSMTCLIHPDNAASLRLAERCGFEKLTQARYTHHDVVLLVRKDSPPLAS